jgi:hypothetical protein
VGALTLLAVVWPLELVPVADLFQKPSGVPLDLFFGFWLPVTQRLAAWLVWVLGGGRGEISWRWRGSSWPSTDRAQAMSWWWGASGARPRWGGLSGAGLPGAGGGKWLIERVCHGREAELQARVDRHRVRLLEAGGGWSLRWRMQECRRLSPEELEALPVHMRRPEVCAGRVAPYRLQVLLGGAMVTDTVIGAGGAPGGTPATPAMLALDTTLIIQPGRYALVTYESGRSGLVLRTEAGY